SIVLFRTDPQSLLYFGAELHLRFPRSRHQQLLIGLTGDWSIAIEDPLLGGWRVMDRIGRRPDFLHGLKEDIIGSDCIRTAIRRSCPRNRLGSDGPLSLLQVVGPLLLLLHRFLILGKRATERRDRQNNERDGASTQFFKTIEND